MIYSFNKQDNCVYGISLMDINYEGKDSDSILRLISSKGKQIKDVEDVPFSIRNLMGNLTYVLPYIYSE
jgi:hypothetical protein